MLVLDNWFVRRQQASRLPQYIHYDSKLLASVDSLLIQFILVYGPFEQINIISATDQPGGKQMDPYIR